MSEEPFDPGQVRARAGKIFRPFGRDLLEGADLEERAREDAVREAGAPLRGQDVVRARDVIDATGASCPMKSDPKFVSFAAVAALSPYSGPAAEFLRDLARYIVERVQ